MINKELLEFFQHDLTACHVWLGKYQYGDEKTPNDSFIRYARELAKTEAKAIRKLRKKLDELSLEEVNCIFDAMSPKGAEWYRNILGVASVSDYKTLEEALFNSFRQYLGLNRIIPGGSLLQGIGRHELYSSLSNCLVLGYVHDSYGGISLKTEELAQTLKRRMGAGLNLSKLRPNGSTIHNQASWSSGPVLFADRFSYITNEVAQYGRRGALMENIHINHPNSIDFARHKQDLRNLTGANISIIFSDEFMQAVKSGAESYFQRFPIDLDVSHLNFEDYQFDKLVDLGDGKYLKKIDPVKEWNNVIHFAWNTGEPGLLFEGAWKEWGTDYMYDRFRPVSTNPCFRGDTQILTDNGYVRIDSVVGKPINVWNAEEWSEVIPQVTGENQEILEITLSDGSQHYCTPYHNWILDVEGCEANTEAKDLKIGDKLIDFVLPTGEQVSNLNIVNIRQVENADKVYCFTEPKKHRAIFNGVLIGQCSEIPMQAYDSCRLMSVNLLGLVQNPFEQNSRLKSDEEIYDMFYMQQTLMDIVVDLDAEYIDRILDKIKNDPTEPEELKAREIAIWEKIKLEGQQGRRTGSGFTALGDLFAALGYQYGDEGSMAIARKIFQIKMRAELDATVDMSILFGSFEGFESAKELGTNEMMRHIQVMFPEQFERMQKFGRRNVSWSTAAPTGSLSILSQTTSGIEPIFQVFTFRRVKCTKPTDRVDFIDPADGQKFTVYKSFHPQFMQWIAKTESLSVEEVYNLSEQELRKYYETSPWYNSQSEDIDWSQRVKLQSLVQQYTTHAISSTVNLPNDVKEEEVSKIYMQAYNHNLKGICVYRDGCRAGVLAKSEEQAMSGKVASSEFKDTRAPKRPETLEAKRYVINVKNRLVAVYVGFLDRKPFELFICDHTPSKPDLDLPDMIDGVITKEEKGIYIFSNPSLDVCECVSTEIDDIKDISLYLSMALRHGTPLKFVIKTILKTEPIAGDFTHRLVKILSSYMENNELTGVQCSCGDQYVFENGCYICKTCGNTKC